MKDSRNVAFLSSMRLQQNDLERHANSDSDFQKIKQPKPELRDLIKLSTLIEKGTDPWAKNGLKKRWREATGKRSKITSSLPSDLNLQPASARG